MRATLLFLIFANLAFFAWARIIDVAPAPPDDSISRFPRLELLSETQPVHAPSVQEAGGQAQVPSAPGAAATAQGAGSQGQQGGAQAGQWTAQPGEIGTGQQVARQMPPQAGQAAGQSSAQGAVSRARQPQEAPAEQAAQRSTPQIGQPTGQPGEHDPMP